MRGVLAWIIPPSTNSSAASTILPETCDIKLISFSGLTSPLVLILRVTFCFFNIS